MNYSENQHLLQVLTINFISVKLGRASHHDPRRSFSTIFQDLQQSSLQEYAANVRDDIYSTANARPRKRDSSNSQLSCDLHELSQELEFDRGIRFSNLSFIGKPDESSKAENILRGLNQLLDLGIHDFSTNPMLQLIAACGIALAQRGQILVYDRSSSLLRDCWLIQDRFERFSIDSDSRSQWSAMSPRIAQFPTLPPPPPQFVTAPAAPPTFGPQPIMQSLQRLEQRTATICNTLNQIKQITPAAVRQKADTHGDQAVRDLRDLLHQLLEQNPANSHSPCHTPATTIETQQ
jgi:hypothetical protein